MSQLKTGLLIFILVATSTLIFITAIGLRDQLKPSDLIVVLGNKVESTGLPSLRLQGRLDKARQLYALGLSPLILVR